MNLLDPPRNRRLSPGRNAPMHDLAYTPDDLARRIVEHFRPRGRLLDPCRGNGAFYNAMLRYSNDVDWCEIEEGRNFLAYRRPVDWIITNPPWSQFRPFTQHAMRLAPNIVFLATITHFVTRARRLDMHRAGFGIVHPVLAIKHPPAPWPGSGFQLVAAWLRKGADSMFEELPEPLPLFEVDHA